MANILVVDDQNSVLTIANGLLKSEGHSVTACLSSRDALDRLEDTSFDLVITDLNMPGSMTGLDLVRTIKRDFPGIPVCILTGKRGQKDVERAGQLGADQYIVKPIEPNSFIEKVRSLLTQSSPECALKEPATFANVSEIVGISQFGLTLNCDFGFFPGSKLKINSELFSKIGMAPPLVEVVQCNSVSGRFELKVRYVEVRETEKKSLEVWLSSSKRAS